MVDKIERLKALRVKLVEERDAADKAYVELTLLREREATTRREVVALESEVVKEFLERETF